MLFYIYSDAPSTTIDITDRCRLTSPFSVKDQAEEGSVALSSLVIDDPNGDLEITGHRRIYIYESEAPAFDQVVFNGFIANEREQRGPYRTGAGSQWTVDLSDPNVLINRRIMNGTDANRPAETDVARITALLSMTELNTVDDSLYFSTLSPVDMDAVDYRGQNVGAYIDDCRQASGKNAYIWYNEAVGQYSLWYDFSDSTEYDSGCFLTNGIGEGNGSTVFEISQERTYLNHDPSRVASGVYLEYDGGSVYVQDSGTLAQFAAIDWAAPSLNVKSLPKATARANRYLSDASTEQDIIHTVMTKVPRASVNAIKKGQLVSFKASYMSAYTAYTVCRVLYRTVTEIGEDPENSFEIEMDLSPIQPSDSFLIAFQANGFDDQPEDLSIVPWTSLEWTGDFTLHSVIACGAGPPSSEGGGIYARLISGGESAVVGEFKLDANSTGGTHVYQIGGIDITTVMGALSTTNTADFVPDGGTATISQVAATESVLIGMILGGKVNYDDGWCSTSSSNWGGVDLMTTVLGTELVNKSSYNTCGGQTPWVWIGYAVGTGTLTLSAVLDAHGGGSGAYTCGYNVGLVSILIPLTGTFSVLQHGFGLGIVPGDTYTVTLSSPP